MPLLSDVNSLVVFIHLSPGNCANCFHRRKVCLNDIYTWVFENMFKLNPERTDFLVFCSEDRYNLLEDTLSVCILGHFLCPTDVIHNLGILFRFTIQVNPLMKSCCANLCEIRIFFHP